MKVVVFVLLSIVALSLGHGWLEYPVPAGGTNAPSNNAPCGPNSTFFSPVIVDNWSTLSIQYEIGNGHPSGPCYFSFAETMSQSEFRKNQLAYIYPCNAGQRTLNVSMFYNYFKSNNTAQGYLQFWWVPGDGTNWYNCARLDILYNDVEVNYFTPGQTITTAATASQSDYYRAVLNENMYLEVKGTGPTTGSVTFYAQPYSLPNSGDYDLRIVAGAGSSAIGSLCAGSVNSTTYITAESSSDATGTYSLITTQYNAYVNYLVAAPQISDEMSAAGYRYYYVLAYSTPEVPKRIVVKSEGNEMLYLYHGSTCDSTKNPTYVTGNGKVCTALGTQNAKKYIQVKSDSAVKYTIAVEPGSCADLGNTSSHLTFSVVLIFASMLISLLF